MRTLWARLYGFFSKRTGDARLDEEIRSHLDLLAAEYEQQGMPAGEARAAARRQFGAETQMREAHREQRSIPLLDSFGQDLRYAMRQLRRGPGFAASAILILALGSGAATAIFSVAYGVMLRDLPYAEPDQLVMLLTSNPRATTNVVAADYFDWRERQHVFQDMALTRPVANFNLTGSGEPERLQGARTTASLFSTLGVTPLLGRTFTEQEQLDPALAERVTVLSYGLWQRRFAGDPSIVGRNIVLNGTSTTVLGVMRPDFRYPSGAFDLWTPFYLSPSARSQRLGQDNLVVARLRSGVALDQARADMNRIAEDLAREYPASNANDGVYIGPMLGELTGQVRPVLWVLLAAVGTLFLVGCVNLANLLVARATLRTKEFATRAALGASRGRLARQCIVETLPLAMLGGPLGVVLAAAILKGIIPLLPATIPRVEEIALNGPVLAAAALLSIVAALLVPLAPAWQTSAVVERGPRRRARLSDALVVIEIAATVVLLVGAGLLIRNFAGLRVTDPGFQADGVLGVHIAVNRTKHGPDAANLARYLSQVLERVQRIPGVRAVGMVNRLPMAGQTQVVEVEFEGHEDEVGADLRSIGGDYFAALGVPLVAGRVFTERDVANGPLVAIIDERVAKQVFGGANPIGKRMRLGFLQNPQWIEVVGVVGHLRHESLGTDPRPQIYWPYRQATQDRMALAIRTPGDPASYIAAVRAAIHDVDPEQPLYDVMPMTGFVARTLAGDRLNTVLIGSFAGLALLLASVGLYGVVSHLTARRSREFGIRLALGADRRAVSWMVLREGLGRSILGLLLGLAAAAGVTRVLATMLHGVQPLDPPTYAAVAMVLTAAVLAASFFPALRASRVDPAITLRED